MSHVSADIGPECPPAELADILDVLLEATEKEGIELVHVVALDNQPDRDAASFQVEVDILVGKREEWRANRTFKLASDHAAM